MGQEPHFKSAPLEPVDVDRPRLHAAAARYRGRQKRRWTGNLAAVRQLLLGAGLCAGFAAAWTGGALVWVRLAASARLQVRRIDITGQLRASQKEVLAYAGAQAGAAILKLDLDAMALRLRQHPWISYATIRRQLPDRLHIYVHEHEPVLLVSLGELYLANAQGQLFKRFEARDKLDVPVVTGIDRQGAAQHTEQMGARLQVAAALAEGILARREDLGRLEEVHWDEDLGWSIVLQPDAASRAEALRLRPGVRAQLGHAPRERLDRVAATLRVLALRHRVPDIIWADGDRTPDRVSVELLAERSTSAAAPAPASSSSLGSAL